ncbi:hypothetical protein [Serratia phage PCH45]|uniref:hypothetical protein n=1 Tax=Serratia phage PCH45 TaxID=2608368 RepID=UPI0012A88144|nr:hypothetical protein [Serratia phage PCH45]
MRIEEIPFNISILQPNAELVRQMGRCTTNEIFESGTSIFNQNGLFSAEIFGPVGSEERDRRFGYIELNTKIFHSLIFKRLSTLKDLYRGIILGTRYAIWDEETKDFVASSPAEGNTGFAFFVEHFEELQLPRTDSSLRSLRIRLIEENKSKALHDKYLVLPAGLRDYTTSETGRGTEDEVNGMYRSLIASASTISSTSAGRNDPILNPARASLQKTSEQIFDYFFSIIKGKRGFILGKWASRTVVYGTANVISPMTLSSPRIGSKQTPGINTIQTGMLQTIVMFKPLVEYYLRSGWVGNIFGASAAQEIYLTDRKTLKRKLVELSADQRELWTTTEGFNSLVKRFSKKRLRNRPINIDGCYLGLVYAGDDGFRIFADIDELPEGKDPKKVYPLNLATLFYVSGYRDWNNNIASATRYPVAGDGSTYIGNIFMRTTVNSRELPELGDDWMPIGPDHIAPFFPDQDLDSPFVETMSPHTARIKAQGGDFDGDRESCIGAMSKEARDEYQRLKSKRDWYVGADNKLVLSAANDNIELLLLQITGGPTK